MEPNMQTIATKYHGCTNTKGSRVSATASGAGKRVFVSYDHSLDIDGNHKAAALKLMSELDWTGKFIGGHTKQGMVFVNADNDRFQYSVERNP